jgi:hypothetical protein
MRAGDALSGFGERRPNDDQLEQGDGVGLDAGAHMEAAELDDLKLNFQSPLERWVRSIQRLQDLLAETSHSAKSEDLWREADFEQEEAQKAVEDRRQAYEEGVRVANFGF